VVRSWYPTVGLPLRSSSVAMPLCRCICHVVRKTHPPMKPSLLLMALGVLLCVICILRMLQLGTGSVPVEALQANDAEAKRESITFILGEDRETDNPFYREATLFYSSHPDANTDYLVVTCRSLG